MLIKASNDHVEKLLRAVVVPVVSQEKCSENYSIYGLEITDTMICAGFDEGGKSACPGDSGGPMVTVDTNILVGIVTWGIGCGEPKIPAVYARVSEVRDWIKKVTSI